jgi:topoisomerase-4 subunit A
VKGFKAHGKRLTTWETEKIEELEPTRFPEAEPEPEDDENAESLEDSEAQKVEKNAEKLEMPQKPKELPPLSERGMSEQRIRDEMEGQLNLFPDE